MRSNLVRTTTATALFAIGGLLFTGGLASASDDTLPDQSITSELPPDTTDMPSEVLAPEVSEDTQAPRRTTSISASNLDDHACSEAWRFVITKVGEGVAAPATIAVTWADGGSATVSLSYMSGTTANYRVAKHLDSEVTSATAVIDAGWTGRFKLSHGPCEPPVTTAGTTVPETTAPATTAPATTAVETTVPATPAPTPAPEVESAGTPAQQLPETGLDGSTMALAGVAMITVGAGLASVRRRPSRTA